MNESWTVSVWDVPDAAPALAALRSTGRVWRERDLVDEQLRDLAEARCVGRPGEGPIRDEIERMLGGCDPAAFGVHVYYPWSGTLLRLLPPALFRELRSDRNRDKITREEQARLRTAAIGIVGLSVGNAVAVTLAQEGVGGTLVLADFDTLSTSNLNRVRAAVADVGLPKTVVAARQIAEVDPFVKVRCHPEGLRADNLEAFLDGLDVVVDECDGLAVKLRLRLAARARRLPVLMETSDRGMLDVERFDLEPDRPLLHGRLPALDPDAVERLDRGERLGLVAKIVGTDVSPRAAASMLEIGATLSTWPQLASDVALGGATVCAAARRLLLGQPLPSGRRWVDLGAHLAGAPSETPSPPVRSPEVRPTPAAPPLHMALVEAATLAPSGGNCQPWAFVSDGDGIVVHHERDRSRSLLDRDGRAGLAAVGASIEGMALRAGELGFALRVEPTGASEGAVARVTPVRSGAPPDPLAAWLGRRFTDRRNPRRVELPADVVRGLTAAVPAPTRLALVTDPAGLTELGGHIGAVDRTRFLHPDLHREMWAEVRWDDADAARRPDGISLREMHVGPGDVPVLQLLSRPEVAADLRVRERGSRLADLAVAWAASASAIGLVSCDDHSGPGWLAAGRAIHRMWLLACSAGFSVQPIGVAAYLVRHLGTELEGTYTEPDRAVLRGADEALGRWFPAVALDDRLLLFRILAGGERYASTFRRPLADVLRVT